MQLGVYTITIGCGSREFLKMWCAMTKKLLKDKICANPMLTAAKVVITVAEVEPLILLLSLIIFYNHDVVNWILTDTSVSVRAVFSLSYDKSENSSLFTPCRGQSKKQLNVGRWAPHQSSVETPQEVWYFRQKGGESGKNWKMQWSAALIGLSSY